MREVEVHDLRVIERAGDTVRLHVECGSGTYVRSLVRDMGEALGCGAHVVTLRRLWVDPFFEPTMMTLEQLQAEAEGGDPDLGRLLPIAAGLTGFAQVRVDEDGERRFGYGQAIECAADMAGADGTIAVFALDGRPLGLARMDGGRLKPQRLFVADPGSA